MINLQAAVFLLMLLLCDWHVEIASFLNVLSADRHRFLTVWAGSEMYASLMAD